MDEIEKCLKNAKKYSEQIDDRIKYNQFLKDLKNLNDSKQIDETNIKNPFTFLLQKLPEKYFKYVNMMYKDYLKKNKWIYQTFGKDAGPSLNYINPDFKGRFGIIAPYSKDFCRTCNRLRITSRGDLRLCLFGNTGISIRHLLQKDDQVEELQDLILGQMKFKKESHYLELGETGLTKNLSTTGG